VSVNETALPELDAAWESLGRDAAVSYGIQLGIADFGGTRTEADTTLILQYRADDYAVYARQERAAGRTPEPVNTWRRIAPYGSSFHNYGAARDGRLVSYPANMTEDRAIAAVRSLASRNGLRTINHDPLHFELPITLEDAAQRWENFAGPATDGGDIQAAVDQGEGPTPATDQADGSTLGAIAGVVVLFAVLILRRAH
jgi:hypothetical protein